MTLEDANNTAVKIAQKYQRLRYKDIEIPVPYFINTAEQVYKQTMRDIGINDETIGKVIRMIKEGKTPLGSGGGKGSPEDITADLERLMVYVNSLGFYPKTAVQIRRWMTEMHVGLDCAGYVYNILEAIEKAHKVDVLNQLAWKDPETKKRSHAGAFIFDSKKLTEITEMQEIKPLDILVFKDHSHVGLVMRYQGDLCLTDCSMSKNGISFYKIKFTDTGIEIEGSESWTNLINTNRVVVRRLSV